MLWWQWIVLGALLLGAELFVDAEFYLVFIGISAIAVGLAGLTPIEFPIWAQWLLFPTLAVLSLMAFRQRLHAKLRSAGPDLNEGVVGETGIAEGAIPPGEFGQVQLRGISWSAKNIDTEPVPAQSRVRVARSTGLTVEVELER